MYGSPHTPSCLAPFATRRAGKSPSASPQPIRPLRRTAEHLCLLVGRRAGGQALERVPQHRIAGTDPVGGKIALEHPAVRPERLDAGLDIGSLGGREFGRGGRFRARMKIEPPNTHAEPAELDHDVWRIWRLPRCPASIAQNFGRRPS